MNIKQNVKNTDIVTEVPLWMSQDLESFNNTLDEIAAPQSLM